MMVTIRSMVVHLRTAIIRSRARVIHPAHKMVHRHMTMVHPEHDDFSIPRMAVVRDARRVVPVRHAVGSASRASGPIVSRGWLSVERRRSTDPDARSMASG